jgi:hypothetical protein
MNGLLPIVQNHPTPKTGHMSRITPHYQNRTYVQNYAESLFCLQIIFKARTFLFERPQEINIGIERVRQSNRQIRLRLL